MDVLESGVGFTYEGEWQIVMGTEGGDVRLAPVWKVVIVSIASSVLCCGNKVLNRVGNAVLVFVGVDKDFDFVEVVFWIGIGLSAGEGELIYDFEYLWEGVLEGEASFFTGLKRSDKPGAAGCVWCQEQIALVDLEEVSLQVGNVIQGRDSIRTEGLLLEDDLSGDERAKVPHDPFLDKGLIGNGGKGWRGFAGVVGEKADDFEVSGKGGRVVEGIGCGNDPNDLELEKEEVVGGVGFGGGGFGKG